MTPDTLSFTLTLDEANAVLSALGQLPYLRVAALIAKLQAQAGEQLAEAQGRNGAAAPDGEKTGADEATGADDGS